MYNHKNSDTTTDSFKALIWDCASSANAQPLSSVSLQLPFINFIHLRQSAEVQGAHCSHSCCMVPQWLSGTANHSQSPGPMLILTAQKQLFSWWPTSAKQQHSL